MKSFPISVLVGALGAGVLFLAPTSAHGQGARPALRQPAGGCAVAVRDDANHADCIPASSIPLLGKLYPISRDLYVDRWTGHVGINTTSPFRTLEVVGSVGVSLPEGDTKVALRSSTDYKFGIVETVARTPLFPAVTNLLATVSVDSTAGAMATFRQGELLTALTTPINNSSAGYVSVRSSSVETAGINGGTGIVFGSAKAFVQPHPADLTKEIQYISLEGPEHGVYARGTMRLVGGEAQILLPESFQLVAREEGMTVNLTPLGPHRGLYVESKSLEGIMVRENTGGKGDVSFDYLVMGQRSAMPKHVAIQKNTHFAPQPGTNVPAGQLPGAYRELMIKNGTLNNDGSVNEFGATSLGWRQQHGVWTGGKRASAAVRKD